MIEADRHTFAIADLGEFCVAIDAADLLSVNPVAADDEPVDLGGVLGLDAPGDGHRHLLRVGRGELRYGLLVRSVSLRDFDIGRLFRPPELISGAMNRSGLRALLALGEGEWAAVLDVAALSDAALEKKA